MSDLKLTNQLLAPRVGSSSHAVALGANSSTPIKQHHIEDARTYLADVAEPEMLDPTTLAQGGRTVIIGLLREGINSGNISDLPNNPPDTVLANLYNQTVGLGILEDLLADERINQINVQGPKEIIVQVNGIWRPIEDETQMFENAAAVKMIAENIARRQGQELSPYTNPIMDLRFGYPPLRIHINMTRREHGISIFIRRGRVKPFSMERLVEMGDFNEAVAIFLKEAAQRLIGTVVLGPVGTGKTVILESYIDHMPQVPIVVVDDAGDCNPSHRFCAIFDLPSSSYSPRDIPLLTLGSLTRAALREGQVLIVAETRGAEEAGILISDAPSMKAVATTAHGENAASGLSRLVSIAQRSDAYKGGSDFSGLRADLTSAFPLVIEMMQRGDRRFISKIYRNDGWDTTGNVWRLHEMVTAVYTSSGDILWRITDSDLDSIRTQIALDRMNRGGVISYEENSPMKLLTFVKPLAPSAVLIVRMLAMELRNSSRESNMIC